MPVSTADKLKRLPPELKEALREESPPDKHAAALVRRKLARKDPGWISRSVFHWTNEGQHLRDLVMSARDGAASSVLPCAEPASPITGPAGKDRAHPVPFDPFETDV